MKYESIKKQVAKGDKVVFDSIDATVVDLKYSPVKSVRFQPYDMNESILPSSYAGTAEWVEWSSAKPLTVFKGIERLNREKQTDMNTQMNACSAVTKDEQPILVMILEALEVEASELQYNSNRLESSLDRLAPMNVENLEPRDSSPIVPAVALTDKIFQVIYRLAESRRNIESSNNRISKLF